MNCKDCIHYPVCSMPNNLEYICEQSIRDDCEYFMRADNTVEVTMCKNCEWYREVKGYEYKGRKAMCCFMHSGLRY